MSKRKLTVFWVFLFFNGSLIAADGSYAVANIPAALLKNANVVKRVGETRYEVSSYTKMKVY
ncbi:MAG TPA: hypothetical protein PLX74_02870, partial [Chitinophagaceae bacterium]|nr:hypothetical protein [Chitinophagaceae bacterium]